MIKRNLKDKLFQLAEKFPIVSVTGPRQSGKTTLIRSVFPDYSYENLEDPETRLLAQNDPKSFLNLSERMIIDEIQRVPELFSYLQTVTDNQNVEGQFIISGSQSFLLNENISQSLAGRVAILNLLPFSYEELKFGNIRISETVDLLFQGFYPRLYDKGIAPEDFYPNYIQTYIERDVRQLKNIQDLNLFVRFMKFCAGRTGQLLNLSSLANDTGISVNTAKSWISLLETSFIIYLLQPHHKNFNKRLVKMPKLYFFDTGLVSSLLEIQSSKQLSTHYLYGAIFENFIISELLKDRFHRGLRSNLYFWRDHKGVEIDCIIEQGDKLIALEIKSAKTYSESFFKNIAYLEKISDREIYQSVVIYGGDRSISTKRGELCSWKEIPGFRKL
jgi:predicted AAA+ superfamily ATPase